MIARIFVDGDELFRIVRICVDGVGLVVPYCIDWVTPWWRLWP